MMQLSRSVPPRARRRLLFAALAAGGLIVAARATAGKLLKLMLYHPRRYEDDDIHSHRLRFFTKAFSGAGYQLNVLGYKCDGNAMQAFLLQPLMGSQTGRTVWVVFGGNAMCGSDWFDFVLDLVQKSASGGAARPAFLLIDYPGYGANNGEPCPVAVMSNNRSALQAALRSLEVSEPTTLNLLGHSLGSAVASQLAGTLRTGTPGNPRLRPGRLVLSAPFFSIEAMAQALLFGSGRLPPRWFLRRLLSQHWDTATWAAQAATKGWQVSIIHGTLDQIVPVQMGKAVRDTVERTGHPCSFVKVGHADHNDVLFVAFSEYESLMGFRAEQATANL